MFKFHHILGLFKSKNSIPYKAITFWMLKGELEVLSSSYLHAAIALNDVCDWVQLLPGNPSHDANAFTVVVPQLSTLSIHVEHCHWKSLLPYTIQINSTFQLLNSAILATWLSQLGCWLRYQDLNTRVVHTNLTMLMSIHRSSVSAELCSHNPTAVEWVLL